MAPVFITSEKEALDLIDKAFQFTKEVGDEWNYDDVIDNLKKAGFNHIEPAIWTE